MTARKVFTARRCTVCRHPDRVIIESLRVAGATCDHLALRFKPLSRDAIWRHCLNHLSDDDRAHYLAAIPLEKLADAAAAEGLNLLQHFSVVRATLMNEFQLAANIHDRHGTASLAGRLVECLRAIGQISGEMNSLACNNLTINNNVVLASPVFANLQATLLSALAPYPDARHAVVAALRKIDEANAPSAPATLSMKTIEHIPSTESATKVVDHVPTASNL
jgi:hypothetical protein